jgi:hypothetical protein
MKFSAKLLYFLVFLFIPFILNFNYVFGCDYESGCAGSGPSSCQSYSFTGGEVGWHQIVSRAPDASCEYGWNYEWFIGADCGGCNARASLPNPRVGEGKVTVEGTGAYAGPNGNAPAYEGGTTDRVKAYCDGNVTVCCTGDSCSGTCVRCDDSMPGVCAGGLTTYGESGTSSLVVSADSTIYPGWITKVKFCGNIKCSNQDSINDDCGNGMCTCPSRGPIFQFRNSFAEGSHTFSIDTSATDGYVPVSMTLSGIAPVTCDGSSVCSITADLVKGDNKGLDIVIRKAPVPPPPAKPDCAYGSELLKDPYLYPTNPLDLTRLSSLWGFYNGGNTSYSFDGGIAKLISAGGNPVSGGFIQQISGLAGKNIFVKAALRRKATGSAGNPYTGIGVHYSTTNTWEWNYPSGIVYSPSSSDAWEIVGNSTAIPIPSNVDRIQPGGNIWGANAGDYYVGWISVCEEEPIGTILGKVVNEGTSGYLKSSAVCSTNGTVVPGLNIGIVESLSSTPGVTVDINQCSNSGPYYTKTLNAKSYDVRANIPAGWEALSWGCTSNTVAADGYTAQGGSSCPPCSSPGVTECGADWSNGTGGVAQNVSLKNDEQAEIWFWIQPIPPKCTISGSTSIVAGETGTFTVSETVGGIVPNVQMKKVLSTCLATNTCISGATLLTSSNCATVGCDSTKQYVWTTTNADLTPSDGSQPWYFYCQGYNGAINLTSRQCRPFNPYAYPWDLDCVSGIFTGLPTDHHNKCDPNAGNTDCIKVNVTEPPPWYQVWGGDVHARGDIASYLPIAMVTADPTHNYFVLNAETLMTGFPGLISYENTYDFAFGAGDSGTAKSSTKKWLAKSIFDFSPTSTEPSVYNYYLKKLGNPAKASFDCTGVHNISSAGTTIIRPTTDICNIDNKWRISGSAKVIVLVDDVLNINGRATTINVDSGAFLAFISKNGINIDHQLGTKQPGYDQTPMVEGVYMTDGQITTGISDNMSGRRFIGAGIFYAKGGFVLGRNLKFNPSEGTARNWNTPAELFIYRPDLAVNSPSIMWPSDTDWQEVAP